MSTNQIPASLAAELGTIREMAAQITDDHTVADCSADLGVRCTGHDAERMADALEAALKLADRWHQKAIDLGNQMVTDDAQGAKAGFMICTTQAHESCSKDLRATDPADLTFADGEVPR